MKKYSLNIRYNVKIDFDIFENFSELITYFYLPLINHNGFLLYSFFINEAKNFSINSIFIPGQRIVDFLNLSEKKISYAINRLEILGLLEVYTEVDQEEKITYLLKKPLSYQQIAKDKVFKDLLIGQIGKENYDINMRFFKKYFFEKENKKLIINKKLITKNDLNEISKANAIELDNFYLEFDKVFLVLENKGINYKVFWTLEFEKLIKNLFIFYELSIKDVVNVIYDLQKNSKEITPITFLEYFFTKKYEISYVIKNNEANDKLYILKILNPFNFLEKRLKRPIRQNEKEFVLKLVNVYDFKFDIINLLLDFSIIINNEQINLNYIEKIAKTLVKKEIYDFENIKNYLKNAYLIKNGNNIKNKENQKNNIMPTNNQILEFVNNW